MKRCLGFIALFVALVSTASAQVNMSAWTGGFKAYRINTSNASGLGLGAAGGGNVLKFPLLVRLTAADSNVFKQAKGNGSDIRFVKSDTSAILPHQIERWDSAGRTASIWVLIDTVYTNNNTRTTRMYWGNPAAPATSSSTAVFDTTLGYVAVWHMNADSATHNELDATANTFTATQFSTPAVTTGIAGSARNFAGGSNAGNNDYFDVLGSASGKLNFPMNSRYTMSAWVMTNGNPSTNRTVIQKHDRNWTLQINGATRWEGANYNNNRSFITNPAPVGNPASPWAWQGAIDTVSNAAGGWQHITTVRDSLAQRLYVNGFLVASNPGTDTTRYAGASANLRVDTLNVRIGRQAEGTANNARNWNGVLDEIRVERVARSANYIRLSYETQRPFGQVTVSSLTPPTVVYKDTLSAEAGRIINPMSPTLVSGFPAVTFAVSPALPAGLTLSTTTGVISGVPTAAGSTMHAITVTNSEGSGTDSIRVVVTAATEANYSSWTGTKTLNFSTAAAGAGVTAAQTHFPLLIRLTPSADSLVFVQAKAGGADIRFSRANGTRLRYEIEHWDATTRNAAIWVQMDNVAPNASNEVRMHWGNAGANSQSSANGVFDRAQGFQAVWHMNAGGTGNESDATANGFTATANGTPIDTVGNIGRSRNFNGTNQYFAVPGTATGPLNFEMTDNYTLSAWIYADTIPAVANSGVQILNKADNQYTIATYDGNASPKYWEITTRGNNAYMQARSNGTPNIPAHTTTKAWNLLTGTYRGGPVGTAIAESLYWNGTLINTLVSANSNNTGRNTTYDVHIGALAAGTAPGTTFSRYWVGRLDEIQMSNVTRSPGWVKLSYETQKPGAAPVSNLVYPTTTANYTIGTAITANTPTARGSVTGYSVSPALPAGLSFNDTTGVISGTPTVLGSGTYTVTAWSGAWFTTASLTINVGLAAETYSNWGQHRDLYINTAAPAVSTPPGAGVAGNVLKFPLLVRLDSANFASGFTQSKGRGADIRFTKVGDVVRLPHQIERWDSAGRKADIWVLVDTVKGNLHNQRIRMHWDEAGVVNASSGSEVFSSANGFAAVWHMNDSASQIDASGNGNTATASAAAPTHNASSIIGAGKTFNGTTNWYQVGTDASAINLNANNGPYSISGWVNPATCAARIALFAKYTNSNTVAGGRQYALHTSAGFEWRLTNAAPALIGNGDAEFAADASGSCTEGTWAQITGTYYAAGTPTADSAGNAKIYLNGALAGTGVTSGVTGSSMGTTALTYIGRIASNERYMNGTIDEVTVSTVLRDSNWIKLSHATQRAGANIVVHTTAPTSIGHVAARLDGPALMVKQMGRGLMFQMYSETAGAARVSLVDMWGRTVWSHTATASVGMNSVSWNGRDNNGKVVASGVYVLQVTLTDAASETTRTLRRTVPFTP